MATTDTTEAKPEKSRTAAPGAAPPARWLWIINNQDRAVGFTLPPVENMVTKMLTPDSTPLTLKPGANIVESKKWAALKAAEKAAAEKAGEKGIEIPMGEIERLLSTRIPRAAHRNRTPEGNGSIHLIEGPAIQFIEAPLAGIGDDQAIAVVDELRDEALLRRLLPVERRPKVAEKIRATIDHMKGTPAAGAA